MGSGSRRLRAALLIASLSFAMGTGATGTYSLAALSPFVVAAFALSPSGLGLLIGLVYVAAAGLSGVIGRLADRVDPIWVVFIGATSSLLAIIALAGANGIALLIVFALLSGLAMAASNPGTNGMIAHRLDPGTRSVAVGLKQSGATGTGLFISAVIPALALLMGWRASALVVIVVPLIAILLVLRVRSQPVLAPIVKVSSDLGEHPRGARWLVTLSVYALLLGLATGVCNGFLVLFSADRLGFGAVEAGLVFTTFSLSSVVARVFWARLAERGLESGTLLLLIACIGALAPTLCMLAPVFGSWLIWPGAAIAGFTIGGWNALAMVTIMHRVRLSAVGAASARMLRSFFAGLAVGPLAFGLLVQLQNYTAGWLLQLAILVVAVSVALVLRRDLRRPPSPTPGGRS